MTYYILFDLDQYGDNYLMQEGMPYITYISTTPEDMYNFILGNYDYEPEDFPTFDELFSWIRENPNYAELASDVYRF